MNWKEVRLGKAGKAFRGMSEVLPACLVWSGFLASWLGLAFPFFRRYFIGPDFEAFAQGLNCALRRLGVLFWPLGFSTEWWAEIHDYCFVCEALFDS